MLRSRQAVSCFLHRAQCTARDHRCRHCARTQSATRRSCRVAQHVAITSSPSKWPFAAVYMDDLPKNQAGKPLRIKLGTRLGIGPLSDDVPPLQRHFEAKAPGKEVPLSEPIPCNLVSVDVRAVERACYRIPASLRPLFVNVAMDLPRLSSRSKRMPTTMLPILTVHLRKCSTATSCPTLFTSSANPWLRITARSTSTPWRPKCAGKTLRA